MLELQRISVTGDPSSGKTEVCRIFQDLGAYVVSADEISHSFLVPYTRIGDRVVALLGEDIIVHNTMDRQRIAEKVFNNTELLHALEAILHPEVCRVINEQYQIVKTQSYSLFVAEVPLLYEIRYADWFDHVLLVTADTSIRRERFIQKKKGSGENFHRRCARFAKHEEKVSLADFVIENNGSKQELYQKVKTYFYALKEAL